MNAVDDRVGRHEALTKYRRREAELAERTVRRGKIAVRRNSFA